MMEIVCSRGRSSNSRLPDPTGRPIAKQTVFGEILGAPFILDA